MLPLRRAWPIATATWAFAHLAACTGTVDNPSLTHAGPGWMGTGGGQGSSGTGSGGSPGIGGEGGASAALDASVPDGAEDAARAWLDSRTQDDALAPKLDAPPVADALAPDGSIGVPPPILTGCDGMTAQ